MKPQDVGVPDPGDEGRPQLQAAARIALDSLLRALGALWSAAANPLSDALAFGAVRALAPGLRRRRPAGRAPGAGAVDRAFPAATGGLPDAAGPVTTEGLLWGNWADGGNDAASSGGSRSHPGDGGARWPTRILAASLSRLAGLLTGASSLEVLASAIQETLGMSRPEARALLAEGLYDLNASIPALRKKLADALSPAGSRASGLAGMEGAERDGAILELRGLIRDLRTSAGYPSRPEAGGFPARGDRGRVAGVDLDALEAKLPRRRDGGFGGDRYRLEPQALRVLLRAALP